MSDEEVARQISDRIVRALNPRKVIWFGSRAAGLPHDEWSDYDFVVVASSDLNVADRIFMARKATRDIRVPKDILVYTPEEYARWSAWQGSVVAAANRTGRVLYAAGDAP
jgi:predicted nucleotidyltransferase